jgi:hypothetical protein
VHATRLAGVILCKKFVQLCTFASGFIAKIGEKDGAFGHVDDKLNGRRSIQFPPLELPSGGIFKQHSLILVIISFTLISIPRPQLRLWPAEYIHNSRPSTPHFQRIKPLSPHAQSHDMCCTRMFSSAIPPLGLKPFVSCLMDSGGTISHPRIAP